MNMSGESLLVVLLVGLVAGWLAGQIVRGTGFGLSLVTSSSGSSAPFSEVGCCRSSVFISVPV